MSTADNIEQTGKDNKGYFILKVRVGGYGLFITPEDTMHNGHADIHLGDNQCIKLKKALDAHMKNKGLI